MADQNSNPEDKINPLDVVNSTSKSDDSDFIKNLVSETGINDQNLLDTAPEIDKSLLEETVPPSSVILFLFKSFFWILVLAGIASVVFFSLKLTNHLQVVNQRFDIPNLANDLSSKNQEIISVQSNINFFRYLQAKSHLDQFSYESDSFLQNYEISRSSAASQAERDSAKQAMIDARAAITESFMATRDKITMPLSAPLITIKEEPNEFGIILDPSQKFVSETVRKLQEKSAEFANSEDSAAKLEYKNYLYAGNLVNNSMLRQTMTMLDLEKLSDQELYDAIRLIDLLALNDFSIIQKIKELRIKWSDIINEIDVITVIADPNYTKENYDSYGGIRYTSYSFETDSRQISVVGETRKNDTTTFTTISNLIDALNKSKIFENAEMRSFSKSGNFGEGYTSSLRISFRLKNPDENSELQAAMGMSAPSETGEEYDESMLDEEF